MRVILCYLFHQARPIQEEVIPMEVTVTASAAMTKQPPRIVLHLRDSEVMEGEKYVMSANECYGGVVLKCEFEMNGSSSNFVILA